METGHNRKLSLLVATWNMGNALPPKDLTEWLGNGKDYDIVVVGAQEADYRRTKKDKKDKNGTDEEGAYPSEGEELDRIESDAEGELDASFLASPRNLRDVPRRNSLEAPKSKNKPGMFSKDNEKKVGRKEKKEEDIMRKMKAWWKTNTGRLKESAHVQVGPSQSQIHTVPSLRLRSASTPDLQSEDLIGILGDRAEPPLPPRAGTPPNEKPRLGTSDSEHESDWESSIVGGNDSEFWSNTSAGEENMFYANSMGNDGEVSREQQPKPTNQNPENGDTETVDIANVGANRRVSFKRSSELGTTGMTMVAVAGAAGLLMGGPAGAAVVGSAAYAVAKSNKKYKRYRKKWFDRVKTAMGGNYVVVEQADLWEMRLIVLVHTRVHSLVKNTSKSTEATGIGRVFGNKGGISIALSVAGTTLCFVCSHLAAHEGEKFRLARNSNLSEIWRGLTTRAHRHVEVYNSFDYLFWMGDLNYRLDLSLTHAEASTWDHQHKWEAIAALTERNAYKDLLVNDELGHEMRAGRAFAGFHEGPITFMPTFKVTRDIPGNAYMTQRVPSYCDRVLWHTLPGLVNFVQQDSYNSMPSYTTSDHKPVNATFTLALNTLPQNVEDGAPGVMLTLDIVHMTVRQLVTKKKRRRPSQQATCSEHTLGVPPLLSVPGSVCPHSSSRDGPEQLAGSPPRLEPPRSMPILSSQQSNPATCGPAQSPQSPPVNGSPRYLLGRFMALQLFRKTKAYPTKKVPLQYGAQAGEWTYSDLPSIECVAVQWASSLAHRHALCLLTCVDSLARETPIGQFVLPMDGLVKSIGQPATITCQLTRAGKYKGTVDVTAVLVAHPEHWQDMHGRILRDINGKRVGDSP